MLKTLGLFIIGSLITSTVLADDAIEASPTSNIQFEKTNDLIMQDETLIITRLASKSLSDTKVNIDVDFHFKNISQTDITRKIAFVLPPIFCREDKRSSWSGMGEKNETSSALSFQDFTTTVDENTQTYTTREEVFLENKNITDLLKKLNIPLNPCKIPFDSDGKPKGKYFSILQQNHLLTEANEPAWSENIYFEWTQTFPANKTIYVKHHYTTSTGGSVLSPRTLDDIENIFTQHTPAYTPIWNQNIETLKDSNASIVKTTDNIPHYCVMPIWVDYNLLTGAEWKNGIGEFTLRIKDDNSLPLAVNQFYKNSDQVQTSKDSNSINFTIKSFIPSENIFIQYLSMPQTSEEMQSCG